LNLLGRINLVTILAALSLYSCGGDGLFYGRSETDKPNTIKIPFKLTNQNSSGLELVPSVATNINVQITGCISSYTFGPGAITVGNIELFIGDRSCLVKLTSFDFNSKTYSATASGATNFTNWTTPGAAGSIATFANTVLSTDTIKVFLISQVTQGGVLGTDIIAYTFTDIQAGTAKSVGTVSVQTGVPLTVQGRAAPNFTILAARFLSINANGSANVSFTAQCGAGVSGSAGAYSCSSIPETQFDYIFIPDAYSQGSITVAQANAAFSANTPTSVASGNEVGAGGSDLNSNTVTNGGFYTSNASPLVTGTTPFAASSLNYVFFIRAKDANSNTSSYIYYYVTLNTTYTIGSTSACSTTFAGGSGTASNPYLVNTRSALANVGSGACVSNSVYFLQVANIDLGGSGNPWTPIGLLGQYEGAGFTISNLYINGAPGQYSGLFTQGFAGSSVSNLILSNVNITIATGLTQPVVGALMGQLGAGATVTNVSSSGSVTMNNSSVNSWAGGLIGIVQGNVSSSSSSVNVTMNPGTFTQGGGVGGLVGFLVDNSGSVSISNSFATGTLSTPGGTVSNSTYGSGGLVGVINDGFSPNTASITNSYATGNQTLAITSTATNSGIYIGGLVGLALMRTTILNGCFSSGTYSITGNANTNINMGGVVGFQQGGGTISNCYSMSTLSVSGTFSSGIGAVGGFIGSINSAGVGVTVSNSYAANASISVTGAAHNQGFFGIEVSTAPTVTGDYYFFNSGSTPSNIYTTGVTSYTTTTQMQTQSNFDVNNGGSFTFGTNTNNWKMPSANPLSPNSLLSPVQFWQCGSNGITCP